MTARVGLGRNHALIAFLLDPDLGILERFAVGTTDNALEGLAECCPRKNTCHCYRSSGQKYCSIKHEPNTVDETVCALSAVTVGRVRSEQMMTIGGLSVSIRLLRKMLCVGYRSHNSTFWLRI
jgi:hypothetical protein